MSRLALLALIAALAGCPRPRPGGAGPTPAAGAGCPAATGVHVASYLSPEPGEQGHTGWVLPLSDRMVPSLEGVAEYAPLDAAAASAAGVPAPPSSLWLLVPGGPPCKATIGGYYAAAIDAPTPNIAHGVELSGCAAPPDPETASAIAIVSDAPPTGCQLIAPRNVATRLGDVDDQKRWQRPAKATPIPPALAAALPPHTCEPPGCETLYSFGQVDVGGKPVAWAGAINWLTIPAGAAPESQCSWQAERFSGFFVAGANGAPVKVTEGQDHPLALTAVLADAGGPRLLLAEGPGEYTVYTLGPSGAAVGRHLVWLVPHPDSYAALDNLGPACEP